MENIECDVVIAGSGVAGLMCALQLPEDTEVVLITKENLEDSNSYLAQGGISIRKGVEDREDFIRDTMKAGHEENNIDAVRVLVDSSEDAAKTLIDYGVEFTKKNGELSRTREGGHSRFRILHHEDLTGKSIMDTLINQIKKRKNIKIIKHCKMIDIMEKDNRCYGVLAKKDGKILKIDSTFTVFATGGIGGIYENSTSFRHIKGDAIAIAIKHNIKLKDISYIQIHPTVLYEEKEGRRFLISEAVRGEGALIYNHRNQRFVDELKPRDIVANAIFDEMKRENVKHEWLNFMEIRMDIKERFPNIYRYLMEIDIDPEKEYVPIVPAHHYTMGGIDVDLDLRTSMENLLAVGEVSCTGVHGKNRLASNSLLECVVFGKRAAKTIAASRLPSEIVNCDIEDGDISEISDEEVSNLIKNSIKEDEYEKTK